MTESNRIKNDMDTQKALRLIMEQSQYLRSLFDKGEPPPCNCGQCIKCAYYYLKQYAIYADHPVTFLQIKIRSKPNESYMLPLVNGKKCLVSCHAGGTDVTMIANLIDYRSLLVDYVNGNPIEIFLVTKHEKPRNSKSASKISKIVELDKPICNCGSSRMEIRINCEIWCPDCKKQWATQPEVQKRK